MAIRLPAPQWPSELFEQGPPEDPSILLGAPAAIGSAPHRVLAIRINPRTLGADYRSSLDEDVYADSQIEDMLDELTFLEDIDRSVLVSMEGSSYVVWMMPYSDTHDD